ncbi:Thyrotropin-releasing hormone-degrading ectoenzyme [Stylophora pistillata]|uniref:Aminopeptidase n=1 Tax=Stylophora pistillata TaxID=50429 RepID=A0A2B4S1A9_STYPI|nr:Thyrotropin-releasing hormone-degrading ectoenzyme [Stylophora pistillata]
MSMSSEARVTIVSEHQSNYADPGGETEEEKEGGSPTPPGPTTAGPEPWWRIRLPDNVIPYHYDLTLRIDMNNPNFKGKVKIWFKVTSPTPYILVHALYVNFTANEVRKLSGGLVPIKRYFKFRKNQFLVTELESSLDIGQYTTTLEYSGEYGKDLRGMYKSSFIDKNGKESFFTATQFEPLRARRAFPCFDEPAMKATFNVTLVHDPNLVALSNMPIYRSQIDDGWKYDHFERTVIMSTYLAAFAVGDFKYKETKTDRGIQIRIYTRPDVLDQADYALKVSNETFIYFEDFFGIKYTLPKSDGIALPVFGPSAMENWGLIKYRETNLLLMEGETSSSSKESIAKLVAHEVGHQWFGNIVTMEWWTDLWLNEGFATYVSSIGMDHVHPEWNIIDQFIVTTVQETLQLDGLASSHPVRIPVEDPQKIGEIFDAISYKKRYLTDHAYGNAETDDLWDAMTKASKAAGKTMDVGKLMNTFTLQMGYPVVTITSTDAPNTYQATQNRFLYYKDPKGNYSSSPYNYKWVIPFTYYTGSSNFNDPPTDTMSTIIDKESVSLSWDGNGWIKGNIGHTGFYRVNYEEKNWDMLAKQLENNYKMYVEYLTKTQYIKLGIKDQGTHLDKFLRTILLDANCEAGVRSCLGNMTKMFQDWMNDPVKNAYLEYALDPLKISPRNLFYVMYYIAKSNEMGANVVWSFFQFKWDVISKMYGGSYMTLRRFIPYVSRRFSTDFELQQVNLTTYPFGNG